MNSLDQSKLIAEAENNLKLKLSYIPNKIKEMTVKTWDSLQVVNTHLPSDTFNTVFGKPTTINNVQAITNYYREKNFPAAWWLGPSAIKKETEEYLRTSGWIHEEVDIGMICNLNDIKTHTHLPENFHIVHCSNIEQHNHFGEVLASIFDPIDENVKEYYKKMSIEVKNYQPTMQLLVGYYKSNLGENIPVAIAAVFMSGVAGIYDIATLPNMRKRGFGSAMFHAALKEAKNCGAKTAVLQASLDGLRIYEQAGFKAIGEFHVWSNKPTLNGEVK